MLQCVEHPFGAANHIFDPTFYVLGPGRFRCKIGKFVAAGERDMHLGDTSSDLRHIMQIGDLLLAFAGMCAARQETLLIGKAIEIGRYHGPGIALIFDKGVNDPDRASLVAFDEFDAAEQRGRVGEARDIGQKPSDLDLGIDAGFQLSIDLDHVVMVYQRRAVGLLSFDGAYVLGLFDRPVRKLAGWPEFKAQAVFFHGQGLPEITQQKRDEDLVGRRVQQRSFPCALTYRRKGVGVIALAIEPHPLDPHRQHVAHLLAALGRFKKSKHGTVVADIAERDR